MNIFFRYWPTAVLAALALILIGTVDDLTADNKATAARTSQQQKRIERGKYLVAIAACNDCHTPGWETTPNGVPVSEWLTGSSMGFSGPWGVSYPWNLRTMVHRMSEKDWVQFVRTYQAAPPMPYWSLHNMTESDLGAIYAFIKSLGPKGEEAPANIPPGGEVTTPYINFSPVFPR